MTRSRRHRGRFGQRLQNWFRNYVLFQRNRPLKPQKSPSAWRRRLAQRYARFQSAVQRRFEPKPQKKRRPAWWIRRWNAWWQRPIGTTKPSRFSTLPLERKLQQLNDRFFSWLFSYRAPKKPAKTKEFRRDQPNVKLQKQIARFQYLNPFQWAYWIIDFAIAYFLTRPLLKLLPAIPAILIVLTIVWLTFQLNRPDAVQARMTAYERGVGEALRNDDAAAATVYNRTLLDLDPLRLQYRYQQAEIEQLLGQPDRARALMQALALSEGSGQAAAWLVKNHYPLSEQANWTSDTHAQYRQLLQVMLDDEQTAQATPPRLLLVQYLEQTGDISAALAELEPLLLTSPQYYGFALELAQKAKSDAALQRLLQSAKRYYREQLERSPGSVNTRVQLAKVLDLLGDFTGSDELMQAGAELSDDVRFKAQMHELWLTRVNRLSQAPATASNLLERWRALHLLVKAKPNDANVINSLYRFYNQLNQDRELYRILLQESSLRGVGSDSLPLLRCLWAIKSGQGDGFRLERQLVYRQGIDLPVVLNNLAVCAAVSTPTALEQAHIWSSTAVREFPSPYFYETRGQVLFRLKRYREAVSDFERAASTPTLAPLIQPHLTASLKILKSMP